MEKLEEKHLACYLPYGLMISIKGKEDYPCELEGIDAYCKDTVIVERRNMNFSEIKPILRPLSDLTKEIETVIDRQKFNLYFNITGIYLTRYNSEYVKINEFRKVEEYLIKNHFDVFGLIEKGLAIDINTLNK